MKNLFYKNFDTACSPVTVFAGDKKDTALLKLLAEETVAAGNHVLISACTEEKYPIEGKVLVSPDTSMVMNLIQSDQLQIIYLASKIDNDILLPFSAKQLEKLAAEQKEKVKIFYKLDSSSDIPKIFRNADLICVLNFNILKEDILRIYSSDTFKSSGTARKNIRQRLLSLIDKNCPCINSPGHTGRKIIFISDVKTLLDENLLIPVVRDLKPKIDHHIMYGSINHYQLKEV